MSNLLVLHASATWFMVGLIWTIQVLHYPLFSEVPPTSFVAYEQAHTRRVSRLLAVPAGVEVATAAAIVWLRPEGIGTAVVLFGGTLLAATWIMTALVQVPLHRRLASGHDARLIMRLVSTNWLRTSAWTFRGILVTAMLVM